MIDAPLEPPALDHFSGSWIIRRRIDDSVIGEFHSADNVRKFSAAKCYAMTAYEYLVSLNEEQ